ncbi:MAG: hypothetical protein HKN24_06510 [Acidimicrobiales bacterium]|nr:hypothetical protein [Acidimicrobiales bacterium]
MRITTKPIPVRLLGLLLVLCAGCGAGGSAESGELSANVEVGSEMSMALSAIDQLNLPEGTVVLAPTNSAVLALDADALARIGAENGLGRMLGDWQVAGPIDVDDLGTSINTVSGQMLPVSTVDGQTAVAGAPLVEVVEHNGVTVLVLDGWGTK